jgi:hypothetical protein
LYFGEHNIEGMLKALEPLHKMLEEGAMKENITIKERAFIEVSINIIAFVITYFCSLISTISAFDLILELFWILSIIQLLNPGSYFFLSYGAMLLF